MYWIRVFRWVGIIGSPPLGVWGYHPRRGAAPLRGVWGYTLPHLAVAAERRRKFCSAVAFLRTSRPVAFAETRPARPARPSLSLARSLARRGVRTCTRPSGRGVAGRASVGVGHHPTNGHPLHDRYTTVTRPLRPLHDRTLWGVWGYRWRRTISSELGVSGYARTLHRVTR